MRKTLLSTLIVAILLGGSGVCLAQGSPGMKNLVTVSVSGYDELVKDIGFIGDLAGQPTLALVVEGMLAKATDGQGLKGIDTTKPWGLIIQTDGAMEFPVLGFVPVTDLKQVLELVGGLTEMPVPEPKDGVYELSLDGPTVFVTQKGGWAFIAIDRATLDNAPADPSTLLGGLDKQYDVAVKASIQNIPEIFRQMFAAQLKIGAQAGMQRMPGESDDAFATRTNLTNQAMDVVIGVFNDLDTLTIGFAIDRTAKTSYLDFEITAKSGTDLASQYAGLKKSNTDLAGFELPGATATMLSAYELADSQVAQVKAMLTTLKTQATAELQKEGLPADKQELATRLLDDMLDVFEKTVAAKKLDMAAAVVLKPDTLTVIGGMTIVEGAKLEGVLKDLAAEIAKDQPEFGQALKLNADKHGDVNLHVLNVPGSELDDEIIPLVGDTLGIVVGISETKLYVGVGRNAMATLKGAIDKSKAEPGKQVAPMRLSVAGTPIAQFVAAAADDNDPTKAMAGQLAATLAQSGGKDHLTVTATAIENGQKVRLEIEEGVLKLIGTLVMEAGQMMGGGAAPGATPF